MAGLVEVNQEEFLAGLSGAVREMTYVAGAELVMAGQQVAARAIQLCPKGVTLDLEHAIGSTGLLRDSKGHLYVEVGVNVGDASTTVDYGFYEEFGSVHNAPHPYMRPAMAEAGNYRYSVLTSSAHRRTLGRKAWLKANPQAQAAHARKAAIKKQARMARATRRNLAKGIAPKGWKA